MSRVAAFFDMDRTLLRVNSGRLWLDFLRERGELSRAGYLRAIGWYLQYRMSILDMDAVSTKVVGDMRGDSEAELVEKSLEFFEERIAPHISDEGRRAIDWHRVQGHEIAILTSSTPYVAKPLADRLAVEHLLCNQLGVRDGRFDGTLARPAVYGAGKVHHAEVFCRARGLELERSYFYTDSFSDLPLLERVAGARVVNPDRRLERFAARVGWQVLSW